MSTKSSWHCFSTLKTASWQSEDLFRGTLTQTSVFPREIVKRALHFNAAAVIFAHNHPSGIAEPSRADEALTQTLKHTLALVDVKVLDHSSSAATRRCPSLNVGFCDVGCGLD